MSIKGVDQDIHRDLWSNIVCSGGCTLFKGFETRLATELAHLAPESIKIKVVAPLERKYSAWIGGAILSSLSSFDEMMVQKSEYEEAGVGIIHRKCF